MKMKAFLTTAAIFSTILLGCSKGVDVSMYAVSNDGILEQIGTITAKDSTKGLVLDVNVANLQGGGKPHGFHIHANSSCDNRAADGTSGAALAAGGHYDPDATGAHHGPQGHGHKGDLPFITSDASGNINTTVTAPRITLAEVKGRAIIIHAGGDNYSDTPAALGGGGARIACGIIQ